MGKGHGFHHLVEGGDFGDHSFVLNPPVGADVFDGGEHVQGDPVGVGALVGGQEGGDQHLCGGRAVAVGEPCFGVDGCGIVAVGGRAPGREPAGNDDSVILQILKGFRLVDLLPADGKEGRSPGEHRHAEVPPFGEILGIKTAVDGVIVVEFADIFRHGAVGIHVDAQVGEWFDVGAH